MSKKILITGSTGKVGNEVINQLTEKNVTIRAAARSLDKLAKMGLRKMEKVEFDFYRPETFDAALDGIDTIFLVPPSLCHDADELLNPFINKAKESGVGNIVYLSVMGIEYAEGTPLRKVEQHLEASGLDYTILRPNWFMQNCNTFMIPSIKVHSAIMAPVGDTTTSFIDIRDIAAVTVETLLSEGHNKKVYTLTGSETMNYYKVADLLSTVSGKNIAYTPINAEQMLAGLQELEVPRENADVLLGFYDFAKKGYNAPVSADVEKILGRAPITFQQYAKENVHFWE